MDHLLSVKDAAQILGISHRTLYVHWWRAKHGLRAQRVGRLLKFRKADLEKFLDRNLEKFPTQRRRLNQRKARREGKSDE